MARGDEAEDDDDSLVVVQHQRRHPVPRAHAVTAADPALALDGNAERLQRGDVPPDRPAVDPELVGDLAAGRQRPCLEQFEQLQQAGSGRQHGRK